VLSLPVDAEAVQSVCFDDGKGECSDHSPPLTHRVRLCPCTEGRPIIVKDDPNRDGRDSFLRDFHKLMILTSKFAPSSWQTSKLLSL
jgi:hypothetical protein